MFAKQLKDKLNYSLLSEYRTPLMGIAASFIMIFHYSTVIDDEASHLTTIVSQFNIGVEMFLLMSGIGLYFAWCKQPKFGKYYEKRILNVYLIYLIIAMPLWLVYSIREQQTVFDFFLDLTGIAFLFGRRYISGPHGGWYVVFIMLMYAVYPLLFRLQKKLEKIRCDLLFVIVFTVAVIAGCYLFKEQNAEIYNRYEIALTRLPIFVIGSYLGKLVYQTRRFSLMTALTVLAGFVVYAALFIRPIALIDIRFKKMLLSYSLGIVFSVLFAMLTLLKFDCFEKVFSFFGKMSLELYLTHNLANVLLFPKGHCGTPLQYAVLIAVSIVVSFFLSKLRQQIMKKYQAKQVR